MPPLKASEEIADALERNLNITLAKLQLAFDVAESETAHQFKGQTCTMIDKDGYHSCPICFFRRRVKAHLGIE